MKILMVCLGNICRSPIAHGVLQKKFDQHFKSGLVDSAGLISFHAGEPPDSRAIQIAKNHGVDISGQVARQIRKSDFSDFDLILTFDQSVHDEVLAMAKSENSENKVDLFLKFAGNTSESNVHDPYYGNLDGFEKVFKVIDDHCNKIIDKILQSK